MASSTPIFHSRSSVQWSRARRSPRSGSGAARSSSPSPQPSLRVPGRTSGTAIEDQPPGGRAVDSPGRGEGGTHTAGGGGAASDERWGGDDGGLPRRYWAFRRFTTPAAQPEANRNEVGFAPACGGGSVIVGVVCRGNGVRSKIGRHSQNLCSRQSG